eukprot:7366900-Alexandrium_andersonii.AAC.1
MAHRAAVVPVAADANAILGSVQDGRVGGCCPEPENVCSQYVRQFLGDRCMFVLAAMAQYVGQHATTLATWKI